MLLNRIEFHYTPKHASWLNMAELEIGILNRQCIARRSTDANPAPNFRWGGYWDYLGRLRQ